MVLCVIRFFLLVISLGYAFQIQGAGWVVLRQMGKWAADSGLRKVADGVATKAGEVVKKNITTAGRAGTALRASASYVQGFAGNVGTALDMQNISTWVRVTGDIAHKLIKIVPGGPTEALRSANSAINELWVIAQKMTQEEWCRAAGAGTANACGVPFAYKELSQMCQFIKSLTGNDQNAVPIPAANAAEIQKLQQTAELLSARVQQLEQERLKNQGQAN